MGLDHTEAASMLKSECTEGEGEGMLPGVSKEYWRKDRGEWAMGCGRGPWGAWCGPADGKRDRRRGGKKACCRPVGKRAGAGYSSIYIYICYMHISMLHT